MLAFGYTEPPIPMVSSYSAWAHLFGSIAAVAAAPSSGDYEAANRAVFQPVFVPTTCVARRVWWVNGSSVSATYNISVAIYASSQGGEPGALVVQCGSTAQGTASQVQFVDITDTTLSPGVYWIAIAASSTSATLLRTSPGNTAWDALIRFQQSSITVGALPSTATPEESSSNQIYLFGFATTASP